MRRLRPDHAELRIVGSIPNGTSRTDVESLIRVTARDPEGETATQTFSVNVEAPAFALSGTVSDRRRNGPVLAGAVVRLDNGQQESTSTDRDGRYRFGSVSGTVTVTASAEPSHVLEEVFIHEGGHVSLDGAHADSGGWRAARQADSVFISEYARDYPDREDVAESILPYFAVRYRPDRLSEADRSAILTAIPNRLIYFDEQGLDMSPYQRAFRSMVPVVGPSLLQPRRIWRRFEGLIR